MKTKAEHTKAEHTESNPYKNAVDNAVDNPVDNPEKIASTYAGVPVRKIMDPEEWVDRKRTHEHRISELTGGYLERRSRQAGDPVMDFLFEYYAFRPSHLERWSPGLGVVLKGIDIYSPPELSELAISGSEAWLDPALFPDNRRESARWMLTLLENTSEAEPSFGCFGMHEWAMVYRAETVRHHSLPLRMPVEELAAFVESRPMVCTHFDAYRFFSEDARPMNKFDLSRERMPQNEQPGCLHTNMDLYKWGFKLYPWISSDTIRKAFELAVETRVVDMKASPYDLREFGLEPIKIETEQGRMEYLEKQKEIYRKSRPVREQLIGEYRFILNRTFSSNRQ